VNTASTIDQLRRQQAALAAFGTFAFREKDLATILTEAARICAECLNVPFAKICRFRKSENDLLIVAGFGWRAGVVGNTVSAADTASTQGRAFATEEPVILEDIASNRSYSLSPFYEEHKIVSTVDVLIKGKDGSWGVLEADSHTKRTFDKYDIVFLTGFANVIAEAVATSDRTASMQTDIETMKVRARNGGCGNCKPNCCMCRV
jgi:GAF domain-containing protein